MPAAQPVSTSIIVPTHNEGALVERTVQSLVASCVPDGEILVVDDQSTDASTDHLAERYPVTVLRPPTRLGSARARNYGAAHARGDALIFCDAHIEVPKDWTAGLLPLLADPDVGAVGPAAVVAGETSRKGYGGEWIDTALSWVWLRRQAELAYPVPMLGGFCLALRREVFETVGGFDPGIVLWGSEDQELCMRLWTQGYSCLVEPAVEVSHVFREAHPFPLPWQTVLYNMLRMVISHFDRSRTLRVIQTVGVHPEFADAYADVKQSDVWQRRAALRATRKFDAEWFCQRFGMRW